MTEFEKAASADETAPVPLAGFGRFLSRSRFIVIIAVVAVLLMAVTLFLLGSLQALVSLRDAWQAAFRGQTETGELTVQSLEIVATMLKAVVFYLVGVGLYSLFIAPLNITVALGIESLNDLESKLISVVVVIMATTFLEHFIRWQKPMEILQFGGAFALVVIALVLFQGTGRRADASHGGHDKKAQEHAQHEMYHTSHEHLPVKDNPGEDAGDDDSTDERIQKKQDGA